MMANNPFSLRIKTAHTLACDRSFGKARIPRRFPERLAEMRRAAARSRVSRDKLSERQTLSTFTVDKVVHTHRKEKLSESRKRIFSELIKTYTSIFHFLAQRLIRTPSAFV
jgi:hypothetical protein